MHALHMVLQNMSIQRAKALSGIAEKVYRCKNIKAKKAELAVNENINNSLTYNVDRWCAKKIHAVWVSNV